MSFTLNNLVLWLVDAKVAHLKYGSLIRQHIKNMNVVNHNKIMQDITRITTDANHELFVIQCTAKLCEILPPEISTDNCGVVPRHVAVSLWQLRVKTGTFLVSWYYQRNHQKYDRNGERNGERTFGLAQFIFLCILLQLYSRLDRRLSRCLGVK